MYTFLKKLYILHLYITRLIIQFFTNNSHVNSIQVLQILCSKVGICLRPATIKQACESYRAKSKIPKIIEIGMKTTLTAAAFIKMQNFQFWGLLRLYSSAVNYSEETKQSPCIIYFGIPQTTYIQTIMSVEQQTESIVSRSSSFLSDKVRQLKSVSHNEAWRGIKNYYST